MALVRAPGNLPDPWGFVVSDTSGTRSAILVEREEVAMPTAVDLNELYDASYRRLVVQLYAICGDLAEAEDAVQDAFVTALRKKSQLAGLHNPEAWVRTVVPSMSRS
jgi:hypothetical protein